MPDALHTCLPSIKDLFPDELYKGPLEPPSLTLARLKMDDDDVYRPRKERYSYPDVKPHRSSCQTSPVAITSSSSYAAGRSRGDAAQYSVIPPHPAPDDMYRAKSLAASSYDRGTAVNIDDRRASSYAHEFSRHDSRSRMPHRNTISTATFDVHSSARAQEEMTPIVRRATTFGSMNDVHAPHRISTNCYTRAGEDDDQTPVNPSQSRGIAHAITRQNTMPMLSQRPASQAPLKYSCSFCGKGFSRPSSLKIHLNSHTGEKPFACPIEGCGRRFSVLSNMRRHMRVHSVVPLPGQQHDSRPPSRQSVASDVPSSGTSDSFSPPSVAFDFDRWQRRGSVASISSTGSRASSRRSRSESSDDELDERPEKRKRQFRS